MTITETFAKYSTKELADGIVKLTSRTEEHHKMMDAFKEKRDLEMFRQAESLYTDDIKNLMDAQLALNERNNG